MRPRFLEVLQSLTGEQEIHQVYQFNDRLINPHDAYLEVTEPGARTRFSASLFQMALQYALSLHSIEHLQNLLVTASQAPPKYDFERKFAYKVCVVDMEF